MAEHVGVPSGAALDQLIAKWRKQANDAIESAAEAETQGLFVTAGSMNAEGWACRDCATELEALRAALDAQPPQAPPWQPIETAPKDGTNVDLWVKTWNAHGDTFVWKRCPNCYWTNGDSMTNHAAHWRNLDSGWYPTHWMLLPDPPVAEGRRAQEQE